MKRLVIWMIVGAICVGVGPVVQAQQPGSKGKVSSKALSAQECKAIERYIANVDAARSISQKGQREEKYGEAQTELTKVLKGRDDDSVLAQALEYAKRTEQVVTTDPTDPRLTEILDSRLKLRSGLLDRCKDFTATR